jgi:hypothetical protein
VVGRSADVVAPQIATVLVFPRLELGPHPTWASLLAHADLSRMAQAYPVDLRHVPPELAGAVRADDLFATISDRPAGPFTLCAAAQSNEQFIGTTSAADTGNGILKQEVACTQVDATASVVTVDLAPMRKLAPP